MTSFRIIFRLLCSALTLSGLFSCGGDPITLRADKLVISAGGRESSTLTVRVQGAGRGDKVTFVTSAGSFEANADVEEAEVATDATGTAIISLYSGPRTGVIATVTANYEDSTGEFSATASISIRFETTDGAALPIANSFRMDCDAINIGALRKPTPPIRATCTLSARTVSGTPINASALLPEFRTEAGVFTIETDEESGEPRYIYSVGGGSTPVDVPPATEAGEPSYSASATSRVFNPRDGLVTVIAVIDGQETFTDSNANGIHDFGEPHVDSPEPFVDVNDNGVRESDETFIDTNGNGRWDSQDGIFNEKTKIMAVFKILWTGSLHTGGGLDGQSTSRLVIDGSTQIANGGILRVAAFALDENMNPIAATPDNNDELSWDLESQGDAGSTDSSTTPLRNTYGLTFIAQASTETERWAVVSFDTKPTSTFSIVDTSPQNDSLGTYSLRVTTETSPGLDADGSSLPHLLEEIGTKITGQSR